MRECDDLCCGMLKRSPGDDRDSREGVEQGGTDGRYTSGRYIIEVVEGDTRHC